MPAPAMIIFIETTFLNRDAMVATGYEFSVHLGLVPSRPSVDATRAAGEVARSWRDGHDRAYDLVRTAHTPNSQMSENLACPRLG